LIPSKQKFQRTKCSFEFLDRSGKSFLPQSSVADAVFGMSSRGTARGWVRIEGATGEARILNDDPAGSLIYADHRFYCLTERGKMTLQRLDKDGFTATGSFQLAKGKDVWAHPVICKGRLLLRYHDSLFCYRIRR